MLNFIKTLFKPKLDTLPKKIKFLKTKKFDIYKTGLANREQLFMYGELLDSSTELVDAYHTYMNTGVNNNSGTDKTKLVKWFLSHEAILEG